MTDESAADSGVARRTVLRRAGVTSAALLGVAGSASGREPRRRAFEADPADVPGLESATVRVDRSERRDHVRYEYSWDPEEVRDLDAPPKAELRLELPEAEQRARSPRNHRRGGDGTVRASGEGRADPLATGAIAEGTAVVEPVDESGGEAQSQRRAARDDGASDGTATTATTLGTSGDGTAETAGDDWDLVPYVETNSLLCGTLAMTELGVASRRVGSRYTFYDDGELYTNDYDAACEDTWYVPESFDTVWFEDGASLDVDSWGITASATYYNDDFPLSGRVWADHEFDLGTTSHDVGFHHYGDLSYVLLEGKSESGYR